MIDSHGGEKISRDDEYAKELKRILQNPELLIDGSYNDVKNKTDSFCKNAAEEKHLKRNTSVAKRHINLKNKRRDIEHIINQRSDIFHSRRSLSHENPKTVSSNDIEDADAKITYLGALDEFEKKNTSKQNIKEDSGRRISRIFSVLPKILAIFLVITVLLIGSLLYLQYKGEQSIKNSVEEVQIEVHQGNSEIKEVTDDGKMVIYKGEKYRYNEELLTILLLGTDRTMAQQAINETAIGINGQADAIILCVIDNKNKKISFINVNRDTMVPVSEYTADGDYAGEKVMQICLAYSYGADNVQSSERMVSAVSKFLYGIPINAYCSLSYDGIPILNDTIGGVTVTIPEDMTDVYPEWTEGSTVTLQGQDAISYVRWRNRETVRTNELRMVRQKEYLVALFAQTVDHVRENLTFPVMLFSAAKEYMTTDITISQVTYLSSKVIEYGVNEESFFSIPGTSVDGTDHVEFYSDDTGLYETILDTFYYKVAE